MLRSPLLRQSLQTSQLMPGTVLPFLLELIDLQTIIIVLMVRTRGISSRTDPQPRFMQPLAVDPRWIISSAVAVPKTLPFQVQMSKFPASKDVAISFFFLLLLYELPVVCTFSDNILSDLTLVF